MNKLHYLYLFFLFLIYYQGNAQTTTIIFDATSETISAEDRKKIPFDEPFEIVIINTDLKKIKTEYKLLDDCGACKRFYRMNNADAINNKFVEVCPGGVPCDRGLYVQMPALHHNARYKLRFSAAKKLDVGDEKIKKLRADITAAINKTFDYKKPIITLAQVQSLRAQYVSFINTATEGKPLVDLNGAQVDLKTIFSTLNNPARDAQNQIRESNNEINSLIEGNCGKGKVVDKDFPGTIYGFIKEYKNKEPDLKNVVNALLSSKVKEDIAYLDRKANVVVDAQATNRQLLEIIQSDLRTGINFQDGLKSQNLCECKSLVNKVPQILAAQAKIVGNLVAANQGFDIKSGQLLLSTLVSLQGHKNINKFDDLIKPLTKWVDNVQGIQKEKANLNTLVEDFPNVLEGLYTTWSAETHLVLEEAINTKESLYLGFDVGFLWAPGINTTLTFQGLNLHFRPVNRNAKFSDLKGFDELLKRLSLNIGIAQRIYTTDDSYESLIAIGSPLAGLGFRCSRMLRINGGVLFYQHKDINPLITDKSVKATPFIGMSIDFELKDAYTKIANF